MPPRAFVPQRPTQSPIKHTTTEYHLNYISTWALTHYAPNSRRLPTALAFDPHTRAYLICTCRAPSKSWKLVGIVDPDAVHAYISDNRTRVRVLGWGNAESRMGLRVWWDLQFVKEGELKSFLDVLDMNVDIVFKSTDQTASTMIQLFYQIPEKAAIMAKHSLVECVLEPYMPPSMRDYEPQCARLGSPPVAHIPWKPETGGLFDGYTQKMKEKKEDEAKIPRWSDVTLELAVQMQTQALVLEEILVDNPMFDLEVATQAPLKLVMPSLIVQHPQNLTQKNSVKNLQSKQEQAAQTEQSTPVKEVQEGVSEEPLDTPCSPARELEGNSQETAQIAVNPHDMLNGGHDEIRKHQVQTLFTSESHSPHTFHEPVSHELEIVADHQLDKLLGEQYPSLTPNAEALSPELMEIHEDPDEIFAFVYEHVALQNIQDAQSIKEWKTGESAECLIMNNIHRNRMHGMPGYEEEEVRISAKQDIVKEHGEVPKAHSVNLDIIRETAEVQQQTGKEVHAIMVSPVEFSAVPEESQQQPSEVRNGPIEEELQMAKPVTTVYRGVEEIAPRRNEEEHNGKEGPTMPSVI